MTEARARAKELESQLSSLLALVNRDDFAEVYNDNIDDVKVPLKKYLTAIRADIRQMSDIDEANFFPGNPIFDNANRVLITDVEQIGVELEFEINPKLESVAKQLAEKAKRAEAGDQDLLAQAFEALDRAIATVGAPVMKAAALATAIKTIVDFLQAMPK